jgi:hypothetical protein
MGPDFSAAVAVASVEEEYRQVTRTACTCGGTLEVKKQTLERDDEGTPYDRLEAACVACREPREFLFAIGSFYGKSGSEEPAVDGEALAESGSISDPSDDTSAEHASASEEGPAASDAIGADEPLAASPNAEADDALAETATVEADDAFAASSAAHAARPAAEGPPTQPAGSAEDVPRGSSPGGDVVGLASCVAAFPLVALGWNLPAAAVLLVGYVLWRRLG